MKSRKKFIKIPVSDVEKLIKDLGVLVVSLDHLGSTYHDDPKQLAIETAKFLREFKAFRILAGARRILDEAYDSQSSKSDVSRLEEEAENLRYWKPKKH